MRMYWFKTVNKADMDDVLFRFTPDGIEPKFSLFVMPSRGKDGWYSCAEVSHSEELPKKATIISPKEGKAVCGQTAIQFAAMRMRGLTCG